MQSEEQNKQKRSRRRLLAAAVGAAVVSLMLAFAASLGGLTVGGIGADDSPISAYDGGITVDWGDQDYDVAAGEFVVEGLTLSPTDPMKPFTIGDEFDVVLADSTGAVLFRTAVPVAVTSTTSMDIVIPGGVSIKDLSKIAVSLETPGA